MKKNYKNHPFRENDVVYHPKYGKGNVIKVDTSASPVHVIFELYGNFCWFGDDLYLLSFTPYEIPSNWERPYEPKDGDIVFEDNRIIILKYGEKRDYHALYYDLAGYRKVLTHGRYGGRNPFRPATEKEKKALFDALEKEGWRWDEEKKELEKIPVRPKEGDLAIAWNIGNHRNAIIGTYHLAACAKANVGDSYFNHCCKFESMEQYEKIRRGEG